MNEENKTAGPISKRDIDVFLRLNTFTSNTFVFKTGMKNWEKISKVPELNESLISKIALNDAFSTDFLPLKYSFF